MRSRFLLAHWAVVAAVALPAAEAGASWERVTGWRTEAGTVSCSFEQRTVRDEFRVACHQYRGVDQASGRTQWLRLGERGRATGYRGVIYQGDSILMPYRQTWFLTAPSIRLTGSSRSLRCRGTATRGMRCANGGEHGFVVRRGVLRRF